MIFNRSAPHARVTPVLTVADVRAAVHWYADAFGFVEHVKIGESHRSQLGLPGGGELIVGEVRPGRRTPTPNDRSHQNMLKVEDAAAVTKRALELGAKLDDDLQDYPYGERQAAITDPFGHQWVITQTLVDTAPESFGCELVTPR
ncbi:MAG TPA: VOC family protein [Kofleriaceae bacterium]|jgi:uncharacterized glyoxalase superfamily protein PhnB|nr:VOC family protein [Kofleriaceae bacterium]